MNRSLARWSLLAIVLGLTGIGSTGSRFGSVAQADPPPIVPAPRLAVPGQAPRPYRHFDFTQPSPFGVIVTYYQKSTGRTKQVFTYPGYRNGFTEPDFLFFGDPGSRHTYGVNR